MISGIPVAKLTEGERTKILGLEDELHTRVIGQNEAVTKVSDAIIRSKAGIKDPTKPIGSVTIGDKDYPATIIGEDSTSDIAVIKIEADGKNIF